MEKPDPSQNDKSSNKEMNPKENASGRNKNIASREHSLSSWIEKKPVVEAPVSGKAIQKELIGKFSRPKSTPDKDAKARIFDCKMITGFVNGILNAESDRKNNELDPCDKAEKHGCGCTSHDNHDGRVVADVVILIDTSSSMFDHAEKISAAAETGIKRAIESCNADARVTYLGVGRTLPGTVFSQSHKSYIYALRDPDPLLAGDNPTGNYDDEEGANAIEDISKYFDWREGACRAVFYISDEMLDSIDSDEAESQSAADDALAAALANNVTVFAHYIQDHSDQPFNIGQYRGMCEGSGGSLLVTNLEEMATLDYSEVLEKVVCGACGSPRCTEAKLPRMEPCIEVRWGDSECDCLGSDDVEVISVAVCNCYSNITFSNFSIAAAWVSDKDGMGVSVLPDGTPSVEVIPLGPICFGDIPPCVDGKPGCVSREFVLRLRGAKSGPYRLNLYGICYDIRIHMDSSACFTFDVCAD